MCIELIKKSEKMSKISVIVPVYNTEKYLSRCIESILVQTYTDFELILINDGSPDNCAQIIEEYAQKDSRIITIHQHNQGLSAARNAGIDIAKGKYITFIDSDDYVYSEYLEQLVSVAERNNADISICGTVRFSDIINPMIKNNFDGEKIITGIQACKFIYDARRKKANYVIACGKLYKKELFSKLRYPVGKLHEDQFLTYKIMYKARKVVEIGSCLYGYYVNDTGIMNSPFKVKRYDGVEALEEAEKFFEQEHECDITSMIREEKRFLIAQNSIRARKAGIYHLVPDKYKMSFVKAKKELKEVGGIERYEYFMYPFYPKLITFEACLRKIKRIVTRKDT